jgi:hypothetical protein
LTFRVTPARIPRVFTKMILKGITMFKKNQDMSYFFLVVMAGCIAGALVTHDNYARALAYLLSAFASAELVVEYSTWHDEKKDMWNRALKVILLIGAVGGAILFKDLA